MPTEGRSDTIDRSKLLTHDRVIKVDGSDGDLGTTEGVASHTVNE